MPPKSPSSIARSPSSSRSLAVRPGETEARKEIRDRLLREAQALARIAHTDVIAVHDAGTHEGHTFAAMEHLEGPDLQIFAEIEAFRARI